MHSDRSPWWYRFRAAVFGAAYFGSFVFGYLVTGAAGAGEPAAMAFGRHAFGTTFWSCLAVAFVAACFVLRTLGSAYLRPATVWNADALGDRLIVDGPFRYVRNPLYLGNVFLAVGFGLFAPVPGLVLLVVTNVAFVYALTRVEARVLRERYGATFDRFVAAVPALVPRLRPASVDGTARATPSLAAGLRSEVFTAMLLGGAIALAVGGTRALPVFYALLALGYVARVFVTRTDRALNT